DQTAAPPPGRDSVRSMITIRHPLQPFDPRNFDPDRPFSFDLPSLRAAQASAGPRQPPPSPYAIEPLDPPADELIDLTDLVRFFNHPVRALLRSRAGLSLFEDEDQLDDQIPITLDGLDSWSIGDRMLRLALHGADLDQVVAA